MTGLIELRSDTFTLPTRAMRAAMANAVVGNDVYREDPTVRELEEHAADLLGKQAGCLLPSGTMANLVAIMTHLPRGRGLLCGDESDIYLHEAGGAAVCGGAVYVPVRTRSDGRLAIDDLAAGFADDEDDPEFVRIGLICLENSHNRCGGRVLSLDYLCRVRDLATARAVALHVDGARLFNAAAYLGLAPAELAQPADSVQFCLSKGLSAPIGSMLVGSGPFIDQARRIRKMLGGGMRQAGVVAAAGIVALERMRHRLTEDHVNARRLADGIATVDGIEIAPDEIQTNIVMFRLSAELGRPESFIAAMRERGVLLGELGHQRIRAVTHAGVTAAEIDHAIVVIDQVVSDLRRHAAADSLR